MNFSSGSLPVELFWSGILLFILLGALSVRLADWRSLGQGNRIHHWLGAGVLLLPIWGMHGALAPGFNLHLIGATVVVLMFDLPLAAMLLAFVGAATTFNADGDWLAFPLNVLTAGWLPAAVSALWRRWTQRFLPPNYFVFLFVTACLGAVLSVLSVGATATLLLTLSGAQPLDWLLSQYTPYYLLLAFAEAWLTGMVVTLMVVWRPGWVGSFDDARYLRGK